MATPTATTSRRPSTRRSDYHGAWATRRSALQCGVPGLASTYGVVQGQACSTSRPTPPCPTENVWSTDEIPALGAEAVRDGARGAGLRRPPAARRPSPPDADRGGAAGQGPGAVSACSGWRTPTPAENQASFRLIRQHTTTPLAVGEVFNTIWDCQAADRGAADRLYPRHRGACRRHHASAPHRRPRRPLPGAHRLPRRHRPVAGLHGGGAAFRPVGAQFRHPGIHAPHRRRPTRSSRTPTRFERRHAASRRRAGPRRRHRRGAGRANIPTSAPTCR